MIVLLSGDRQVGKSTVCQRLVELAGRRGKSVGGFISEAVFDAAGEKSGIRLVDPRTGQQCLLASVAEELDGPRVGIYYMSAEALRRGTELARAALKLGTDLLLIDELGPLELARGEGFASLLPALRRVTEANCLIVVRPELLDELDSQLVARRVLRRYVNDENRNQLPVELARLFWGPA